MTFPKTRPPHNIRVLHGWLREYAGERGQAEGRLKRTVDYTLVLTVLDRARDSAGNRMFAIKGGVAMELRLRLNARATRDLDAVFLGAFEEWLEAFDEALDQPVADFELSRGEPATIRTTRTVRVDVYLDYRGRRWGTVTLEVAPTEVDLQLARQLLRDDDLPRVRDACIAIFDSRGTHPWPPDFAIPAAWPAAYERLVEEESTEVASDLDGAIQSVEGLICEINRAKVLERVHRTSAYGSS